MPILSAESRIRLPVLLRSSDQMEIIVFLIFIAILVFLELVWYRAHAVDEISLDVSFSKNVANFGEIIEVIEVAENNKRLPLPFIILKFETPAVLEFQDMTNTSLSDLLYREDMLTMKPFSRHTRRIKAKCTRRGYYSFTRVNVSTSDLLLIEKLVREFPSDASITILPERLKCEDLDLLLSTTFSDVMTKRTLLTDPFAFAGIREYQPFDPMKNVNWKATARTGELMVNQNASTSTRQVTIFLNLEYYNPKRSDDLLEAAISIAYSYISELAERGIPSALYTNGRDCSSGAPVMFEMNTSSSDMLRRGIELARIDMTNEVLPFAALVDEYLPSTSVDDFVVVISPRKDDQFKNTLMNIKSLRKNSLWILPCHKEQMRTDEGISGVKKWEVAGHD